MSKGIDRRTFLKQGLFAAGGLALSGCMALPSREREPRGVAACERLNIAGVGCGGKGASDIKATSRGQNVVALCDVDEHRLGEAAKLYPGAKTYTDWRKLLEQKDIDALTISTPDHMHAPIALAAMELGKHVYVQKPLTLTVLEARQLALAAKKYDVVTQMGNQGHSSSGLRSVVKTLQDGVIGRVKEAHVWTDRPIWPQGIERPKGAETPPSYLHWDGWLGVAPYRPYVGKVDDKPGCPYHPFRWRGYLDFGTGALGDMGCHLVDPTVWGLALGPALRVWSDGPAPNSETYPTWEIIHCEFAPTPYTAPGFTMTWYDGGKRPPREMIPLPETEMKDGKPEPVKITTNGTLYIGERGVILCSHGGPPQLLPKEQWRDYRPPVVPGDDHYQQWVRACKGICAITGGFDYSGPLTETVPLGTIAVRFPGKKLEWNSKDLKFTNEPLANAFVHHRYREGWQLKGL